MPASKIVLNASPLILLCNGELEFILPAVFTEIVVPTAVLLTGPGNYERLHSSTPNQNADQRGSKIRFSTR